MIAAETRPRRAVKACIAASSASDQLSVPFTAEIFPEELPACLAIGWEGKMKSTVQMLTYARSGTVSQWALSDELQIRSQILN